VFVTETTKVPHHMGQKVIALSCKVDEWKPLPVTIMTRMPAERHCATAAATPGLTLVHFLAQRKRFLWDMGCVEGLFRGVFEGMQGMWRV